MGVDVDLPVTVSVAPGVWAIPVPIPPGGPPYTLVYALVDDDGCVRLVDAGWDTPGSRIALERGLREAGIDIDRLVAVVATHHHPDHLGLAAHLRERTGARILLSGTERRVLAAHAGPHRRDPGEYRATLDAWGVPEDRRDALEAMTLTPSAIVDVEPDREVADGELLDFGDHRLRAVLSPGHTDGHLCLVDDERAIIYTGDHVLPRINPGIGLGTLGVRDPLVDYLESLALLAPYDGFLVLPGHEEPFRDLGARRTQLARHHLRRTREVLHLMGDLGDAPVWAYAERMRWTGGWAALHGFMLHSALSQTERHLGFARSGRAESFCEQWGLPREGS